MIRYGLFYNFNDMGQIPVGNKIDTFFIASIIDAASVGAYALGNRVLEIVRRLMPHRFFLDVIRPLFFTLDRVDDSQDVTRYFQLLVKLSYLFMIPVTAYVAVAHRDIFEIVFGGKFQEFSSLLVWLFCFASLTAFEKPLTLLMQLHEKAAIILISGFARARAELWRIRRGSCDRFRRDSSTSISMVVRTTRCFVSNHGKVFWAYNYVLVNLLRLTRVGPKLYRWRHLAIDYFNDFRRHLVAHIHKAAIIQSW
jgi:hypothetical protein